MTDRQGNGWEFVLPIETVRHATAIAGDLNYNGRFDAQDLDILTQNVAFAPDEPHGDFLRRLDLNGDKTVDTSDVHYWVTDLKSTFVGDANLDGEVKFDDFLALSANFGQAGGWAEGDFNADEQVNFPDFLALSANFGNVAAATHAEAVPEPTAAAIAFFGDRWLDWLAKTALTSRRPCSAQSRAERGPQPRSVSLSRGTTSEEI